jgi:hypothetical protein
MRPRECCTLHYVLIGFLLEFFLSVGVGMSSGRLEKPIPPGGFRPGTEKNVPFVSIRMTICSATTVSPACRVTTRLAPKVVSAVPLICALLPPGYAACIPANSHSFGTD